MSLSDELLDTARRLAVSPSATEADTRRAISTAYYALFHRLVETAVAALVTDPGQQRALGRRFSHTEIRKVCQLALKSPLPPIAVPFFGPSTPADLKDVAKAFGELQDQRHAADYDTGASFASGDADDAVQTAQDALDALARLAPATARPFLVLLLVGEPKPPR